MELNESKTEFNWLTRLNELVKLGNGYRPDDYCDLLTKAKDWPTCACGQLCILLPKNGFSQAPEDTYLHLLGLQFFQHVFAKDWTYALNTFLKIEARTTELLIEMGIVIPKHEQETKPANGGGVPYCVEPDNVPVFPASSNTFATTASGSTDSKATQRLHSVHGMPAGN